MKEGGVFQAEVTAWPVRPGDGREQGMCEGLQQADLAGHMTGGESWVRTQGSGQSDGFLEERSQTAVI